jgi:DNA-binding NarL/FixJ family response regulator
VAVIHVRLPPTFTDEGLRAAIGVRAENPRLPILMHSPYVEQHHARELLSDRAGAVGHLLKERVSDVKNFIDTVRRVADGAT